MVANASKRFLGKGRNERGMALLFALCILSIALVMALIFSQAAFTERKVSTVSADSEVAKSIADSMAWRGLASIVLSSAPNRMFADWVCSRTQYLSYQSSPTTTSSVASASNFDYDWMWKIKTPGLYTFSDGPFSFGSYNAQEDAGNYQYRYPSWEYVWDEVGSTNSLIGRYAYVAMSNRDKVNVNALAKTPDDDNYSDSDREKRYGVYPSELELDLTDGRSSSSLGSFSLSTDTIRNGWTSDWSGLDDMILKLNISPTNTEKTLLNWFLDFTPRTVGDYEKFATSMTTSTVVDRLIEPIDGEQYRISMSEPSSATGGTIGKWDSGSITVEQLKSAIPYFSGDSSTTANQTLANLITAFSPDTETPVSDVDAANWGTAEPTYTGNKRTPYLNELAFKTEISSEQGEAEILSMDVEANTQTVKYNDCKYKLEVDLKVETCTIFQNPLSLSSTPVTLYGTLDFEYYDGESGSWKNAEQIVFEEKANNFTGGEGGDGYSVYETTLEVELDTVNTSTKVLQHINPPDWQQDGFYSDMKIQNVTLTIDKIILADTAGNADLALMPETLTELNLSGDNAEQVVGTDPFSFYGDVQVNDPRCNLQRDQWTYAESDETNWTTNIGVCNSSDIMQLASCNNGTNYDKETATDPAWLGEDEGKHLSTAFIRHDAPKSFWEIGAISRGEPWRTINFNCAESNSQNPTFGDYDKGDGHLLDQITMNPMSDEDSRRVLGKINLNCINWMDVESSTDFAPMSFRTLFNNLKLARSYTALDDGEASDAVTAETCAKALAARVIEIVNDSSSIKRRTAIFPDAPGNGDESIFLNDEVTDARREELICRIMNLLKWDQMPNQATVLVLAQSIRDVGGLSISPRRPDDSTQAKYVKGFYDPDTGDFGSEQSDSTSSSIGTYDQGIDLISGEAKAIYRIRRDAQGKWIIAEKEYAY